MHESWEGSLKQLKIKETTLFFHFHFSSIFTTAVKVEENRAVISAYDYQSR